MKQLRKTEDQALDRLLRGHLSQQGLERNCKQFDPDLVTAFVEHSLTMSERDRYEQHLSLCAACRTATVALMRLAAAEAPASLAKPRAAAEGWRQGLSGLVGVMATPRWAMAATAVIVLAVSIPVLLSRVNNRNEAARPVAGSPADTQPPAPSANSVAPEAEAPHSAAADAAGTLVQNKTRRGNQSQPRGSYSDLSSREAEERQIAMNRPPAERNAPASEKSADETKKEAEAGAGAPGVAQTKSPVAGQQQQKSDSPSQQQAAGETQLPKIDQERALRQQQGKDSAQDSLLKQGRPDGDQRADLKAKIRPEDDIAPPSPIAAPEGIRNRALAQPGASAMHDGRLNESARGARGSGERKIGSKKFWLRDEIWTDKDYRPEKEMPVVTIVRDSDVYKEVIGKRAGLKVYLTAFGENDRAIVVYKGTIYKLIPQQGTKN